MKNDRKNLIGIVAIGLVLFARTVAADPTEWVLEKVCDFSDVVDCEFNQHDELYKYGAFGLLQGGMAKIRSEAAYCLLRDARERQAKSTLGDDWYEFGITSRYHLVHAGKDSNGMYEADGQRLLDLILFGESLRGIELQDIEATFPKETQKGKLGCLKKIKIGKKDYCTQFALPTVGYYLGIETNSYSWSVDIDDIVEYFTGPLPGFEATLEQDAPYEDAEMVRLSGVDLNLTDGLIPANAGNNNSWQWGSHPCPTYNQATGSCPDPLPNPTTRLNGQFPLFTVVSADFTLRFDLRFDGFFALHESPDPENPGPASSQDPDYASTVSTTQSALGGATGTSLASGMNLDVTVTACVDVWFGEWCADFTLFNDSKLRQRIPLNWISYGAAGNPLKAQWSNGTMVTNPSLVQTQINNCLAEPSLDNPPEEMAQPDEWREFTDNVNDRVGEHYHICQLVIPTDDVSTPTFKLCDDRGIVYEAMNGFYLSNQ